MARLAYAGTAILRFGDLSKTPVHSFERLGVPLTGLLSAEYEVFCVDDYFMSVGSLASAGIRGTCRDRDTSTLQRVFAHLSGVAAHNGGALWVVFIKDDFITLRLSVVFHP